MALTNEQVKAIKQQLLSQINKLPESQRAQAKQYIESMSNPQLEEFLKQNQMIAQQRSKNQSQINQQKNQNQKASSAQKQQCVFCMISKKQLSSLAIYEDKNYLSVLEIRPFINSEGHTILIPKKHIKETKSLPSKAFNLANKIGKHLVKKLKAQTFQITSSAEGNTPHAIINIIPIYKKLPLSYERKESKQEELQNLAIKIGIVETKHVKKKTQKKSDNQISRLPQFPRRIP